MVARVPFPEILTMAPQVQGAKGEMLVELVEIVQGEVGTREEVEVDTEGEILLISSSNKAIDLLVSRMCM